MNRAASFTCGRKNSASFTRTQRKKYFDEVQTILAKELPMIYTVSPFHFAAVRPDLANLRPSVLTPYRVTWNVEELYFKKP